MHCSSTTLFWHCSIPYCPILSIKCFRGHKSPGSLCQGASLSLCLSFVVHFRSKALVHYVLFKDWNVASLVDGLSTKEQWPYSSFHEAHKSYAHFNMFFLQFSLSVKDHLFMPHVRPVKLAGGGKVVKVQNYFNAFIKLSHPLTKFAIQQPL